MIDIFIKKVKERAAAFNNKIHLDFWNKEKKIKKILEDSGFLELYDYLILLKNISVKNDEINLILNEELVKKIVESKIGKKFYGDIYKTIKDINLDDYPIKTVKAIKVINNYSLVVEKISGKNMEFIDYDLIKDEEYLLLRHNGENIFYQFKQNYSPKIFIIRKMKKEEVELKDSNIENKDKIDLSSFYEEKVNDILWNKEVPLGENAYNIYFEGEDTINKIKEIERLFIPMARNVASSLVNIEKKAGEGKMGNIKDLSELFDKYENSNSFLDRNFYYLNREKVGNIYIISDLHGSKEALVKIMNLLNKDGLNLEKDIVVFLGDYVDRGKKNLWVLYHVLKLKKEYPGNILLLKGNHEYYKINNGEIQCLFEPHDFLTYMNISIFDNVENNKKAFSKGFSDLIFTELFKELPVGVFLNLNGKNIFLAHSGFTYPKIEVDFNSGWDYSKAKVDRFPHIKTIEDFNQPDVLQGLFWTRMVTNKYKTANYSISKEIGKYSQDNFMGKFKIDLIIRGHEHPDEGFEALLKDGNYVKGDRGKLKDSKILTFFSGGGNKDSEEFFSFKSVVIKIDKQNNIKALEIKNEEQNMETIDKEKKEGEDKAKDGIDKSSDIKEYDNNINSNKRIDFLV